MQQEAGEGGDVVGIDGAVAVDVGSGGLEGMRKPVKNIDHLDFSFFVKYKNLIRRKMLVLFLTVLLLISRSSYFFSNKFGCLQKNAYICSLFRTKRKETERMIYIANPIYDVVFKFLMSDERIARTILAALLKMDIVNVKLRPHEYPNSQRDALSVFRIDFAATIREPDGNEHIVLIELQKTWLETETLRFRQYLGVQYQNPSNMDNDGNGLPMVAVYLLGHCVGDIEEPVLYVRHDAYDYDGQVVTKGLPDPFVSSLTHDSVIVQIPLLRGRVNTRLDRVLSIFDQTQKSKDSQHTLCIDDSRYDGDDEMQAVIHRLLIAAADADMRQDMNVEDEYFSAIEKRDTEILTRDRQLAEKTVQLRQQEVQIKQKEAQLEQKDAQLEQKDAQLKASVQALYRSGMSMATIAETLKMDIAIIESILP